MSHQRHWTVQEANAALAYLGPRIDEMRELLTQVNSAESVEGFARAAAESGGGWPGAAPAEAAIRLDMGMREMTALDVVIRDLEQGLVDFPAMIDGEEVYLCWLREETAVTHFHRPESGFAGRRPL